MEIDKILKQYWGYSGFRPLQRDIIESVLQKKDTLALLPTGGGKSICFQVPAMAQEGVCIVVSPLIALMKDQVENLRKKGIPAVAVVSGMSRSEIDVALDNCVFGKEKFLYVSPERLSTEIFIERLKRMKVNLLAIDEAHCISQWGYDFRPAYLKIAEIRQFIPTVPVLALTATATKVVEDDIQARLGFISNHVFRKSFERKNLAYVVLYEEDKFARLLKAVKNVDGSGVVYVRTRKRAKEIAEFLKRNEVAADFYHAGLDGAQRAKVQDEWMKDKTRIVVSTNAFGMGIDKPNVRIVVHMDVPESIEAYYQEAGRAGRDEKKSFAVLLFNNNDRNELEHRVDITFPPYNTIRKVYQALGNYLQLPVGSGQGVSFDFDISDFCSSYNLPVAETFNCLKILELQGLISTTESIDLHPRIHFTVRAEDLYDFQVRNPGLDPLVKLLLRSYEGVFDEFVSINENDLAFKLSVSADRVREKLKLMDQMEIIRYQPAKDKPQLTFLEERLDQKDLYIDREHLANRKIRFEERIRSMLNYAETKNRCRSQMLVGYFGENDTVRCGVCDYCLERNKAGVSDLEFETIQEKVRSILTDSPHGLEELIKAMKVVNEDKTLHVIEWLIDKEEIAYDEDQRLILR